MRWDLVSSQSDCVTEIVLQKYGLKMRNKISDTEYPGEEVALLPAPGEGWWAPLAPAEDPLKENLVLWTKPETSSSILYTEYSETDEKCKQKSYE